MVAVWFVGLALLAFAVPSNSNKSSGCASSALSRSEWELRCPTFTVYLRLFSGRHLRVRCTTDKPDFDLLQTIPNLPRPTFHELAYDTCPMPVGNQSLVDALSGFIDRKRLSNITQLFFVENANYSEPVPLEPALFSGLNQVRNLSMKASANLPLDNELLFADLTNLTLLDLREGDGGSDVTRTLLRPLINLKTLELMENGLTELPAGLVSKLPNLTSLTLYGNQLKRLDKFVELPQLNEIDLSDNQLTELREDVFEELPALSKLELKHNHLTNLPGGLLQKNMYLTKFSAAAQQSARLVVGNGLFAGLKNLSEVSLARCHIDQLPEDLFDGATSLKILDLSNNVLQSLPEKLLHNLPNLEEVHLSHNKLVNMLPDNLFRDNIKLRSLYISHNSLTTLNSKLLRSNSMLNKLDLQHNRLDVIDRYAFEHLSSLDTLNLSHNRLALHRNGEPVMFQNGTTYQFDTTPFLYLESVTMLDLSHNEIVTIFNDFKKFMHRLSHLNLSHNRITQLSDNNFNFLSNVAVLDLQSNNITLLNFHPAYAPKLPAAILLDDNPINCECRMYPLVQRIHTEGLTENSSPLKGVRCANPPELAHHTLYSVAPSDLFCLLVTADVLCSNCTCHKRPANRALVVNCSGQNLTDAPAIPSLATLEVPEYDFIALNLANNMLRALPNGSEGWNSVRQLYVANNNLTTLPYDRLPDQLEILDASGNQLSQFDPKLVQTLANRTKLRNISLSANPWRCGCDEPLLQFVTDNVARITDFTDLQCADGEPINSGTLKQLCDYRTILIVVLCVTVTCLAVVGFLWYWLYTRYQHEIKVWLFKHDRLRWLVAEEQIDQDKRYDAFISYSHKDEDFIVNTLMPRLEREPMHFKVCWHVRDFMPGELISSQITKAVEQSRRTIIVLSPNYIESVWGQMEFNTAYLQSVTDKRNRVIPIVYEDIGDIETLDAELRAYLKTNTYVRWDDPWFWDKLRYAMPHPCRLKGVQASNNIRMASVDKLNLLQIATQMSTPSLNESTPPPIESTTPPPI